MCMPSNQTSKPVTLLYITKMACPLTSDKAQDNTIAIHSALTIIFFLKSILSPVYVWLPGL